MHLKGTNLLMGGCGLSYEYVEHGCKGTCVKFWGDITGDDNGKFNAHLNNTISGPQHQL